MQEESNSKAEKIERRFDLELSRFQQMKETLLTLELRMQNFLEQQ